jgi:citronellol/citronellal dehydrogenase
VNNASAISLTPTPARPPSASTSCLGGERARDLPVLAGGDPHLRRDRQPHILTSRRRVTCEPKWFAGHVAYTMSKYGMSMCTLGMAEELRADGIAVNSLWPRTTIATAAVEVHFPEAILRASRHAAIMADAAHAILTSEARTPHGQLLYRRGIAAEGGVKDFRALRGDAGRAALQDLFVDAIALVRLLSTISSS